MNNSFVNNFLILSFFLAVTLQGANQSRRKSISQPPKPDLVKTRQKAAEALKFCKSRKFNDLCILVDVNLHSGVKGSSSGTSEKTLSP